MKKSLNFTDNQIAKKLSKAKNKNKVIRDIK